ncbi:type VI immunity family protein [Sorangium sp. So ce542]|uniref:type VI immunity family protein n=1 Tax=Sorangium sp. So ce542 TaxID=3133316 RepID=UPI003F5F9BAD
MRLTLSTDEIASLREKIDQRGTKGQARLKLCLEVTLYYDGGFQANGPAIVAFFERALPALGQKPRYWGIDGENRWKTVKGDVLELVRSWASGETAPRERYGLRLESGPTAQDVSDLSIRFYDDGRTPGFIRLLLPLERLDGFPELARELAEPFRFLSGHGGLSTNTAPDYPSSLRDYPVFALSRRFRGIDFGDPLSFSRFVRDGIKCVSWLTFVGDDLAARGGGRAALKRALGSEVAVVELAHGLLIQAGPAPSAGDVNRQDNVPLQHHVGRVLRDLRFPESSLRGYDGIGGTENTLEWLQRFDT